MPSTWRLRTLAACALLPPLVSVVSFARIAALVGRVPKRVPSRTPGDAALSEYVGDVLRRLPPPWRYSCLRRGVVLYHLIRRAGRHVSLHVGVRRDAAGALTAHAWLGKDGVPYLEADPAHPATFAEIARFPESGP